MENGTFYFEFNKHEYWALIASNSADKALQIYLEEVGHNTIEEIIEEGFPDIISKDRAFCMFLSAESSEEGITREIEDVKKDFNRLTNTTILITKGLA